MPAKNFKGGMDSLLGGTLKEEEAPTKRGRPRTNFKEITKTSQLGTKANETRATFIVSEDQLETIKALAYWDRLSIKQVVSKAIEAYITSKKRELPKAVEAYKNKE